ncbi:MAG: alpha/beta hydrolase [Ruthenibacterium sp.]|jgi:putative tributyrin esterase
MALISCNFFSEVLKRDVGVNVCIPTPNSDELLTVDKAEYYVPGEKFKCVYLLHGAYGDHTNWCRHTRVEKYAEANRVAVVMPSIENSFCMDMLHGENYRKFVGEELVKFSRYMFPISQKREENCICGLSMGGYSAYYVAFHYPHIFGKAASLSGALDIEAVRTRPELAVKGPFRWEDLYRPGAQDVDLLTLYNSIEDARPRLYQTCGTEDFLYNVNEDIHARFVQAGADIRYETGPGKHDWDFWDAHIAAILAWAAA